MGEEVTLFEHNEIAYTKLCEALKTNRCATINHATGTGKSFIALKYLYNNRDKKYLYLAPTYPIIEQLKQSAKKIGINPKDLNIDTMIYRNLLEMDMDKLYEKYDGIIFDEYHRVGAFKTYKKIKELKYKLVNSNDDKKFIGLTATPIRYLDNERNMTKEVFDNVVASTLPLSDAMIDGLLPVPYYINSKISCVQLYNKILKKMQDYPPVEEKKEILKKLLEIGKEINNEDLDKSKMINKYITEKDGKYIVFCSNINRLNEYYTQIDKWFSKFKNVKKYKVHSGIEKEKNQQSLNEFNNNKEGISVMLCVELLNEGIHVDDIDGVILLRKTISPIIYFQQIGRALSFSGRNRQIKIFDLVNNFEHHNAIDLIYKEYADEIKKRIKEQPEKADEYKEKLERFKIKDETQDIIKRLYEINKSVDRDELINSKVEYAVTVFEDIFKETEEDILISNDIFKEAFGVLSKHYKYVTTDQFIRLQKLNAVLPMELSYTLEEREQLLNGFDTIHEKEKNVSNVVINQLIQFVHKNGRNVKLNEDDINEKNLAMKYLYFLPSLEIKQKEKIKNVLMDYDIPFKSYEKALFGIELLPEDFDDIIRRSKKYIDSNHIIPEYLVESINNVVYNYDVEQNIELLDIIESNVELIKKINKEKTEKRYEKVNKIMEIITNNESASKKDLEELGVFEMLEGLSISEINYLKRQYTNIKKKYYKGLYDIETIDEIHEFKDNVKTLDENELMKLIHSNQNDINMFLPIKQYVEYLSRHNGQFPKENSQNLKEREIAQNYKKLMDSKAAIDIIDIIKSDTNILLFRPEFILEKIFDKKYNNILTKKELLIKQFCEIKEEEYKSLFDLEKKDVMQQFCMDVKRLKLSDLPNFIKQAKLQEEKCLCLKKYYEFIIDNNGKKPEVNSNNELESKTALLYKEYVDNGLIEDVSNQIITDDIERLNLQGKEIKKVLNEKYNSVEVKRIILQNVEFLLKNQRRPLNNSRDKNEKILAELYKEKCIKLLSDDEITELNKLFNSSKYLTNTSVQYAKNKKMEEMQNEKQYFK